MKLLKGFDLFLSFALGLLFMCNLTEIRVGERRLVTLNLKKRDGSKGQVDGVPAWSSTGPDALDVQPNPDGLSAYVVCKGQGMAVIKANPDVDMTSGEHFLPTSEDFVCLPPLGADTAGFDIGDAEPIPAEAVTEKNEAAEGGEVKLETKVEEKAVDEADGETV